MRRVFRMFLVLLFIALIGIQFIDVKKTNPPVTGEIDMPYDVKNILRSSCYDCHSNETKWPVYSKVAPISWLIADDVQSGRKHLNFSEWESYTDEKKAKKLKDIWEQISEDEMPIRTYTYLHPGTQLDIQEKQLVKKWLMTKTSLD